MWTWCWERLVDPRLEDGEERPFWAFLAFDLLRIMPYIRKNNKSWDF